MGGRSGNRDNRTKRYGSAYKLDSQSYGKSAPKPASFPSQKSKVPKQSQPKPYGKS